ncbi:DUF6157 family protein [Parapedobacter tibetensis]|uniref:DUF6157 family protein n=1 Tax=Parapedobacter tibetensis TaxID=2972951 RepID=UPI00214D4951|nr:DUF6157 family protein [Parapedobacter tibetensis]
MKVHSTNYYNMFIVVADDCPTMVGEIPQTKGDTKSIANIQFELISKNPYQYTSDEVLFQVYAQRKDLTKDELDEAKAIYFSKGQACLRASPLTKRYGWGVHHNEEGKIALYGCETEAYGRFLNDKHIKVVKAMKTSR